MNTTADTRSWPDLAIGLYDRLTGRNAQITYEMDNLQVMVPSGASADAAHAKWVINGSLKIQTSDLGKSGSKGSQS